MIFDGIIFLATSLVNGLINTLLPVADATVTAKFSDATATIRSLLVSANWFVPIDYALFFIEEAFLIAGIVIVWMVVRFVAHMFTFGAVK